MKNALASGNSMLLFIETKNKKFKEKNQNFISAVETRSQMSNESKYNWTLKRGLGLLALLAYLILFDQPMKPLCRL